MAAELDLPVYGSIYDGDVSYVTVELVGGGLDIEGVVGDDLDFAVFFGYQALTGYTFEAFVVLNSFPLRRTFPLVVVPVDLSVGLINVRLPNADTTKIGPVAARPWFLRWRGPQTDVDNPRTVLMGKFQLNRS